MDTLNSIRQNGDDIEIVNQLLLLNPPNDCAQCGARRGVQRKYLDQIEELYEDFHVVKLPLVTHEVRGPEKLKEFSELLIHPYEASSA